jgi:sarcosine oxidase
MRADIVVIGGGVTGLGAARALRARKLDVIVLDQAGVGHLGGGSHGSCRIFRLGYDDPLYVTAARQARELWTEIEAVAGERLLHPLPQLTVGPEMPRVREAMRLAGAPSELLPAAEAAARFPGVTAVPGPGRDDLVLLEPDSAVIAADRALAVLAGQAAPDVRTGVRVTTLADDGRRVTVSTSAGDIDAGRVIVCAGPWSAGLLATAGIWLPGRASLEQVAYLAPAGPGAAMPIFVHYGGEFPYGLPVPGSDRYKFGLHQAGPTVDPNHQDQTADPELSRRTERAARTFLPGHDPRPVATERCVYDNSPDTDFIIDRIGNVVVGCGTSGHGFKFGPLLGLWLAELAASQATRPGRSGARAEAPQAPPARFRLGRFRRLG